jgi:hypothetical protein
MNDTRMTQARIIADMERRLTVPPYDQGEPCPPVPGLSRRVKVWRLVRTVAVIAAVALIVWAAGR